MARPRNNFAIAKDDRALHGVLTAQQIRDMRPALGPLNARLGSFLRRFTLPCSTGTGKDRQMYIKMPESVLDAAPTALRDELAPHMTPHRDALAAEHPFIDDPEAWRAEHNAALDTELGPELGDDEGWQKWEAQ